jgi:hypothetical protein
LSRGEDGQVLMEIEAKGTREEVLRILERRVKGRVEERRR